MAFPFKLNYNKIKRLKPQTTLPVKVADICAKRFDRTALSHPVCVHWHFVKLCGEYLDKLNHLFYNESNLLFLSHAVASGSEITLCNKIDKQLFLRKRPCRTLLINSHLSSLRE